MSVVIHGQKVPVGPHCMYMNLATLPVKSSSGFLVVKTRLNGSPTVMVADTGRLHTLLTLQEANKLGLKLTHTTVTQTGADGVVRSTYATFVDDVSLDKFFWHGVRLAVADSIESERLLAGADILLNGLNRDVEFSVATRQIKFFAPSAECRDAFLAYWDNNALAVPLSDLSAHDPRQVVTVEINGHQMTAMIDSGAPISMINLEAAARVGITPQSPGVVESTGSSGVGKQYGKAWLAPFESFAIGGEVIKNARIAIADLWGPAPKDPTFQGALRLASITPLVPVPGSDNSTIVSEKSGDALARIGAISSESLQVDRPDMLLGADFLRSHRVLLAMSQRRMYYTYLGGTVFGNNEEAKTAERASARLVQLN